MNCSYFSCYINIIKVKSRLFFLVDRFYYFFLKSTSILSILLSILIYNIGKIINILKLLKNNILFMKIKKKLFKT